MCWLKVELECSKSEALLVEEVLFAHGASSINFTRVSGSEFYEPDSNHLELWDSILVSSIFSKDTPKNEILAALKFSNVSSITFSSLKNINWLESFMDSNKARRFGKDLWIVPSWDQNFNSSNDIIVNLDLGMAFGSGSHETTSMCLEHLERNKPTGKVVIDYGCGTGILAISALKLGAEFAYCIDKEKEALDVTRKNAKKNGVVDKIQLYDNTFDMENIADIVIANIYSSVLIKLQNKISLMLKSNGVAILSGILEEQLDIILSQFSKDFRTINIRKNKEWIMLYLKKI